VEGSLAHTQERHPERHPVRLQERHPERLQERAAGPRRIATPAREATPARDFGETDLTLNVATRATESAVVHSNACLCE